MSLQQGDEVRRAARVELRAAKDDGAGIQIAGLGVPYESRAVLWELDDVIEREIYARGCFRESLATDSDIISCFNHDRNLLLGRQASGSLTVREDDAGVHFAVRVDAGDDQAMRVWRMVDRGDLNGASVRMRVDALRDEDPRVTKRDGVTYVDWRIERATLREIGPVVEPVYAATTAETRSRDREQVRRLVAQRSLAEFNRAIRMPS